MPIDIENDSLQTAINKLKARENTFLQLEKVSRLGSWEVDLKTKESQLSQRTYEIYGFSPNQKTSLDTFFKVLLPEYHKRVKALIEQAIKSTETKTITCKAKRSDGKIISILLNAQVFLDEDGNPSKLIGTTQDITEYLSLKEQTKELSELIEHSSNEIYIIDRDKLNYLYVNHGACSALGYAKKQLLNMNFLDINPELTKKDFQEFSKHLQTKKHLLIRTLHKRKNSSTYYVQSYIHTITYKNNPAYVIFDTNISQMIELELEAKKQAKILEYIHDSVISVNTEGTIKTWNRGSYNLFGYESTEIINQNIEKLYSKKNPTSVINVMNTLRKFNTLEIEAYMYTKGGGEIICDLSLSVLRDEKGKIDGFVGYIQDISEQKKTQQLLEKQQRKLEYQAHHDMLTHLPNRTLFQDRLTQTILHSKRNNENFALFFIDLDQFKNINDSLGHHIGDAVLKEAALRIKASIREEDTLARLGGDEFTIILKDIKNQKNAADVAQKIIKNMKKPIEIKGHLLHISSSIGISLYPQDAQNEDNLVKYADVAMYKAKEKGRDNFQFYSLEMSAKAFERVIMENSLRVAVAENQFIVYYQPQYNANNKNIIGMEALVRWQHPNLGLVPPDKFIPLAEETGLIKEIDTFVMHTAMAQFKKWYDAGLEPGVLALNLSMKQLNEKDFVAKLQLTMSEYNFNPLWLELEVTESQMMNNPNMSIEKLNLIHNLGIEIAIDDFGTGYSSLSYLKKLPLDKLKIDKAFIQDIPDNEDDRAITDAIIALGRSLNLKLIAEGVETKEQEQFLIEHGCNFIQGYLYSKPIPAKEIDKLLK